MRDEVVSRNPEPIVQFGQVVGWWVRCSSATGRMIHHGDWVIVVWRRNCRRKASC